MTSHVPWGSVLRLVVFNVFVSSVDGEIVCILSTFVNDTKLICMIEHAGSKRCHPEGLRQA